MRRGQQILLAALVLGACMFVCSRLVMRDHLAKGAMDDMREEQGTRLPELEWLRHWLHLNDAQFDKVKALHLAYRPKCQELCQRVQEAEAALRAGMDDPRKDLTVELRVCADARLECQRQMLAHVRETAACMDAVQAGKYLDAMLPHVLGLASHSGACPSMPAPRN